MARQRLSNVKLDEISFVGKGDNPEAHVLLLKTKPEDTFTPHTIVKLGKEYAGRDKDKILKGWMDVNVDRIDKEALTFDQIISNREIKDKVWGMVWQLEDSISSIMCDDAASNKSALIQQSVDQFKTAITPITKEKGGEDMPLIKMTKERDDALAQVTALTKTVEDVNKENVTLKASAAADKKMMEDMADGGKDDLGENPDGSKKTKKEKDIFKGLPESIQKEMSDNRARIAKMEDDNLNRDFIAKAAPLTLVGKAEDLGPLLKTLAKSSPEAAEKVLEILKTANARIAEGDLLKEKGAGSGDGGNSAIEKIQKKAQEYKVANPAFTIEKAFTAVYDAPENAELKKQYLDETRTVK